MAKHVKKLARRGVQINAVETVSVMMVFVSVRRSFGAPTVHFRCRMTQVHIHHRRRRE
jgi:hypothetical protein